MNRLFFALLLMLLFVQKGWAAVSNLEDAAIDSATPKPIVSAPAEGLPNPENLEEVRAFFAKRIKNANVSSALDLGDLNKSNAMDIQHSAEYIAQMQEEKKSALEKIYDEAMKRVENLNVIPQTDTVFYEEVRTPMQQNVDPALLLEMAGVNVVNVTLPNGKKVLAPAREHIPYLLVSYNILPSGLIEIEEDIVVVANAEKLKSGLVKKMPKYSVSRSGVKKKLGIELQSVEINGQPLDYKVEEIGKDIYIKPQKNYELSPGVYTYKFKYFLDRKLWYYKEMTEFYADVTGSYLNLVIASANAVVSVPEGANLTPEAVMTGYVQNLSSNKVLTASLADNALGFASVVPLNVGEGMHILVALDRNVFVQPSLGQRFAWFVTDYGDILFALLGFAAILVSYILSWQYIRQNKSVFKVKFRQTPASARMLVQGSFDLRAFVASLLDLYYKKVIDLNKEGLIKLSDNLKNLSHGQKKVMAKLFPDNASSVALKTENMLKFKRAYKEAEKDTVRNIKWLSWRLNTGYLLFSLGMLIISAFAVSYIAINPIQTGLILLTTLLTLFFYVWIVRKSFSSKIKTWVLKTVAGVFIVFSILFLSIYIKFISAFLFACMVYTIFEYSALFSKKNGLMKYKYKEVENLKKYLETNAENIANSSEFMQEQANIFAFGLTDLYANNSKISGIYKLDVAESLLKIIR